MVRPNVADTKNSFMAASNCNSSIDRMKVQMRNNAFHKSVLIAIAVCLGSCSVASAQFGRSRINYPLGNPTISPYLNLIGTNSGAGAGINYFGLGLIVGLPNG